MINSCYTYNEMKNAMVNNQLLLRGGGFPNTIASPSPRQSGKTIKKECKLCGKVFWTYPSTKHIKFCSRKCAAQWRVLYWTHPCKKKRIKRKCQYCGKSIYVTQWDIENGHGKFCSIQCIYDSRKKRKIVKCSNCGKERDIILSKFKLNKKLFFCDVECQKEYQFKYARGEHHQSWKGGVEFWKTRHETSSPKYNMWRNKIFRRDNYTCYLCKEKSGKLEAHHLKSWKNYPKLRYTLYNGITLCYECHLSNRCQA